MNQRPGTVLLRILVVVLTAILGAAVADRVMGFSMKRYVATVTLQVRSPDFPGPETVLKSDLARELILSREVLEPVTKSLALPESDPVSALRRSISVKEIRNTELVQISVAASSPIEAARQANAVAEEFARTRIVAMEKQTTSRLENLQAEVEAQRAKVQALKAAADRIRTEAGINDLNPDGLEQKGNLAEAITKIRIRTAILKSQHDQLSALTDAQVLREISYGTELGKSLDPTISGISTSFRQVENEETIAVAKGQGELSLAAIKTKKAELQKQLSGLVPILRKRIENAAKQGEAEIKTLEQLAVASQPKRETSEKYEAAKQEYLQQRKILEDAEVKLATENMETKMPRSPVVIWERAEPPATPDSRPRIMLTLGVLLGLIVGVGLAFLPKPGITAGIVLVLLGVASFPRWSVPAHSSAPVPSKPFTPRISIGGDVKAPQLLDFAGDLTVLRVINAAGGFTEYANRKKVRLLREGKVIVIDVTAIVADPTKDIPLKPGDCIEVPQSFW